MINITNDIFSQFAYIAFQHIFFCLCSERVNSLEDVFGGQL